MSFVADFPGTFVMKCSHNGSKVKSLDMTVMIIPQTDFSAALEMLSAGLVTLVNPLGITGFKTTTCSYSEFVCVAYILTLAVPVCGQIHVKGVF